MNVRYLLNNIRNYAIFVNGTIQCYDHNKFTSGHISTFKLFSCWSTFPDYSWCNGLVAEI